MPTTTAIPLVTATSMLMPVPSSMEIVVAGIADASGNTEFAVVRFNGDGSLDTTLVDNDIVITNVAGGDDEICAVVIP